MSTINVYSLNSDGLSIETYVIDLEDGAPSSHKVEVYKNAKTRRARVATLSETHIHAARIERHPTAHATAWMVREPGPDTTEYAVYFGSEFVGYAPTRNDAESRIDDMVYDLLTRQDIAAKAAQQENQAPEYEYEDDDYAAHNAAHALEMSLAHDDNADDAAYLRELAEYDLECQYGADESAPPLDCGDLHRALSGNPSDAYHALATLSESQLTRQAIAYAAVYGLDWWGVLKDWQDARG